MRRILRNGEGILLGVILAAAIIVIAVMRISDAARTDTVTPVHIMEIEVTQPPQVNINTADKDELMILEGIGETLAEEIIQWRTENGLFVSVDQLNEVPGIGDAKLNAIRDRITID